MEMKRTRERYAIAGILSALFVLSGFTLVLMLPITSPVIVVMGSSSAEREAVGVLQDELPSSIVVAYGDIQFALLKHRCVGAMIVVGHGDGEGFRYNNREISGDTLLTELLATPSQGVYLLSCSSAAIAKNDDSGRTFGFSHPVDASLAAAEIAIRVNIAYGLIGAAIDGLGRFSSILQSKLSGESPISALMPIDEGGGGGSGGGTTPPAPQPYFSSAELFNCAVIFLVGCGFALVGVGISAVTHKLATAIGGRLAALSTSSGILAQLYQFFKAVVPAGASSILTVVNAMFGGLFNLATLWAGTTVLAIGDWIASMDLVEWAIFLTLTALEVVLIILTLGAEVPIRLAAGIGIAAANSAIIAISDGMDTDGTPCQSFMQAVSQLLS